jgi:hypothetical protein
MVLQVMSPAIREIVPERKRDDTWLRPTENGSTRGRRAGFSVLRFDDQRIPATRSTLIYR